MTDENPFGNAAEAEPPARKSKRWIWIAGIGCAVLFVPCLGVVATIVVPALLTRFPEAQRKKAEIDLQQIAAALDAFRTQNGGQLPESLEPLVTPDGNGRTYLRNSTGVPLDPWGRPYTYEVRENGFRLASVGPDGVVGGDDVEHRVVHAVIEER